jgi:phytoene dehydrogenase-like protein
LQGSALGRRFLEISALSPLEFVERNFENDTVRACLMFINGMREIDLRLPGFGHSIPSLLAARGKAQMAAGGSASLAGAIVADIAEHGGEIRCGVELRRILMRGGGAAGVELSTGEELHASAFIASGLNPQQTFLQLLDADAVPARVREQAAAFRYNVLAPLLTLHLALDEPPRYTAAARRPELARAFMVIAGLERFDQFSEIVAAHERGSVPAPVAWGACPTVFDPSQAPPGRHTAFMWEKLPYALHGDPQNWEREKEAIGARLLAMWCEHAPNLRHGIIRDQFLVTPRDVERTLPNMVGGDSLVGSFENDQLRYHRPFAGAGAYRAPVPGLYLCGGSTHPGGNVTGLCGYNAARVLAADLGKKIWWNPPDVEQALANP